MLYLIGLGLNSKSVSVQALKVIKNADHVFLENYTSIFNSTKKELEEFYERKISLADRDFTEKSDEIVRLAKKEDVCFLVIGDVFSATTHTDIFLRAKKNSVEVEVLHNASILTAVGITGLELYKFGKTTSIVFPDDNWMPKTPYTVLKDNKEKNMHTLFLLDIKVSEPDKKDMLKTKAKPNPPRFMTIKQALEILLELESTHKEQVLSKDTLAVGVARLGEKDQLIKKGSINELLNYDFKGPLHSLIIPAKLHFIEEEVLSHY